ncbi:MAG: hypothetical protein KQ78_01834 [Candidatus Izimaplasma bacterium HR2]|nr:MAG: hypothetical protein KQ78_01834 [Candidatus Izimaplasma bacterium HR2]
MTTKKVTTKVKTLRTEKNEWRELFNRDNIRAIKELECYFSEEDYEGFDYQMNRGKIADLYTQYKLGIQNPVFDKIDHFDFIYQGKRIQFKYLGQNSSPSITEFKKGTDETYLRFVNRIMKYYRECDVFMITLENFITDINKKSVSVLTSKQFKKLLMLHVTTVKDGNKLRLRKIITRNYLNSLK